MLIDELKIFTRAGKGGDGVVRWRSERGKPKMGPAGGNGGNGADVYIRAVRDINILSNYVRNRKFLAENGGEGMKDSMIGKNGENLFIDLPIGSVVTDTGTGKKIELLKEGEEILILKGGRGGLGNEHFKSSKNTTPMESTPGREGEESEFFIELRLIADIGLIGLPSAGKSSLLNELTRSRAKIGAYPFTTLEPNLGEFYGYILADIPGIIEGASEGKGLGHKFLRHIERTKILAHCVSFENEDVTGSYKIIRDELQKFSPELLEKPELIVLTKFDVVDSKKIEAVKKEIEKINPDIKVVSIYDDNSLKELSDHLTKILRGQK
ncbi:Obg family GTPase CgtA [Patescibacteria group bacterium]|nr:Obg family GTPase CgtA [Patescibacteria group bacterium]